MHLLCLEVTLAALHGIFVPPSSESARGTAQEDNGSWVWNEPVGVAGEQRGLAWTHELDLLVRQTYSRCTAGASGGKDGAAELQWRAGRFLSEGNSADMCEPPMPSRPTQVTIAPRRGGGNISTSTRAMPRVNLSALAARSVSAKLCVEQSLQYLEGLGLGSMS